VLLDNPTTAAAFASDELGTLIDHSPRAETIRETLFVWLLSGSRTATASELKVHENTVRQRLHFVAEELGPSFASRRSELLAALRICRAMGVDAIHAHT
jgi:DNA-binding PucR family transcriptional regulator